MVEKSERNKNKQKARRASFGKAAFISFPCSESRNSDARDILTAQRIRHFSQSVLSAEAWFRTANELTATMELLQRHVERFLEDFNSPFFIVDQTSDPPSTYQKSDVAPKHKKADVVDTKHNLINQHMMLAGFAIENLCKGYLAGLLSPKEQKDVKAGKLPKTLNTHDILELVRSTGMALSNREKDLLDRIGEAAIWSGRYPSPIYHEKIVPFAQWGDDVGRIKTFLPKLRAHVGAKDS